MQTWETMTEIPKGRYAVMFYGIMETAIMKEENLFEYEKYKNQALETSPYSDVTFSKFLEKIVLIFSWICIALASCFIFSTLTSSELSFALFQTMKLG